MRRNTWFALAIWLLSLAAALNTGRDLLYNTFYLITAVLIGSWLWAWLNVQSVSLTRRVRARRSQVGKWAEEQFEVVNRSRLPKLWLEIRDHSTLPGHHPSRVVSSLGRHQRRSWYIRTFCYRRGRYLLGPLTLRSGDPLGIFEVRRGLPYTTTFLVYPPVYPVHGFRLAEAQAIGGEAPRYRTHYVTPNVATVREYVPGDSFNRIHWRSTARTGRLMVKEFELDPASDIWIVLDLDARWHAALLWEPPPFVERAAMVPGELPGTFEPIPATIEYAVAAAASLASHFLNQRRALGLIAYTGHREIIQPDRGERQLNKILEMLAVLEPVEGVPPFDRVLMTEGSFLGRTSALIAISPSVDREWALALRELRRRGVHSTAIVVAADSFGAPTRRQRILAELWANNVPTYLLERGQAIGDALAAYARPT